MNEFQYVSDVTMAAGLFLDGGSEKEGGSNQRAVSTVSLSFGSHLCGGKIFMAMRTIVRDDVVIRKR